jgi:hypothetical protein
MLKNWGGVPIDKDVMYDISSKSYAPLDISSARVQVLTQTGISPPSSPVPNNPSLLYLISCK